MTTGFKVCGLTTSEGIAASAAAGATHVGFVFYDRSPRSLTPERAGALAREVPDGIVRVGLTVDASDAEIDAILDAVPLDMIQLHGRETPERAAALRRRLPVMRAVGVRDAADLDAARAHEGVVDMLLLDAKPAPGALPGGNGAAFDWALLSGRGWAVPWMLAGGLTPDNAADAAAVTGAPFLDVSSGVESAPGVKDPERIAAFGAALARR
jgi:phosphoribosylanthranilate isomerase